MGVTASHDERVSRSRHLGGGALGPRLDSYSLTAGADIRMKSGALRHKTARFTLSFDEHAVPDR